MMTDFTPLRVISTTGGGAGGGRMTQAGLVVNADFTELDLKCSNQPVGRSKRLNTTQTFLPRLSEQKCSSEH